MKHGGAIIVRGQEVPIGTTVHTWATSGLFFMCRARSEPTRAIMNHWTGSENAPRDVFQHMRDARDELGRPSPKSVHFFIDQLGEIWQCADTDARCAHAKAMGANAWSIGIEHICRGHNFKASQRGYIRPRVTDIVHGVKLTYDELTPAQVYASCMLNHALCKAYDLPMRVPEKDGDVLSTTMPPKYAATFRGVLGHYMVERLKVDPAVRLMRSLNAYAREVA